MMSIIDKQVGTMNYYLNKIALNKNKLFVWLLLFWRLEIKQKNIYMKKEEGVKTIPILSHATSKSP